MKLLASHTVEGKGGKQEEICGGEGGGGGGGGEGGGGDVQEFLRAPGAQQHVGIDLSYPPVRHAEEGGEANSPHPLFPLFAPHQFLELCSSRGAILDKPEGADR